MTQSRWTLDALRLVCPWLATHSCSGVHRVLAALGIHAIRGRDHVHSPDPAYEAKCAFIEDCLAQARCSSGRVVVVYEDEVTFYRQPTLATAYAAVGEQPLAERSYRTNTTTRVAGALDALSGQTLYRRRSALGVDHLVGFYQELCAAYPQARRIYMVQDNWPVHFHPDLLVALEPQESPFPLHQLSWSPDPSAGAVRRWGELELPIQVVPLPTYASWLNPIEKLWRWLKQEVLHLHRLADDLDLVRQRVDAFLDQFAVASPELLRYVGLAVPD